MALQPWPNTREGDKGHPVFTLQYLLRQRGQTVTVDGDFGPKTETAVRAFQQANQLAVDGIAGQLTWSALIVTVRRGSTGDAVRAVQEELRGRDQSGDPQLVVDGDFGTETEAGVRAFQEGVRAGTPEMAVDGIVGPMTWQAMVSGMLSH
ncbi:peptidoglycan-binding domain-containing protein [Actinoplanes aureus]|uniref:Peptidoglycan-binding protein n=1 Tax=Actinoplanes aureus TaxID=2792083 RepID=A0A931CLV3_9ACTN|nr:peptidoglycan-binding protein [Actinoplanes aureus]MBG0567310.1 peptidoglycan-binding protein [Actinoplanes aureus]